LRVEQRRQHQFIRAPREDGRKQLRAPFQPRKADGEG
jgi:hypothetical protein